jgi:S-(hydroxymethyl)glutathione dehydrogenase/alcohol dehydrogenase
MRIQAPVLSAANEAILVTELDLDPPAASEVLVRMVASGVCHSCLDVAKGVHDRAPLPIVLGDEGAGVVEAVGSEVTLVGPGDHVVLSWAPGCGACRYCRCGRPVLCLNPPPFGFLEDGATRFKRPDGSRVHHFGPATYSPYVVVSERAAIPITRELGLEEAALLGCSVTTGVGAVVHTGAVTEGQSVAVFGCGGVGLNAVQGARLVRAHPIVAIDPRADRLVDATALGATHTVRADDADVVAAVRSVAPDGIDCAIIAVGSARVLQDAWATLGHAGTAVLVGNPQPGEMLSIEPRSLLMGERKLIGSKYGSANPAEEFPRLAALALAGELQLGQLVSRRYTMAETNEAFADLESGSVGRGLVVFASS